MPSVYPHEVILKSNPRGNTPFSMLGLPERIANLTVNTEEKIIKYEISNAIKGRRIAIHGFVPRGWKSDILFELDSNKMYGQIEYKRSQEKNILDGLMYISAESENEEEIIFAQLDAESDVEPSLENYVTINAMAGNCAASITIFGIMEEVEMKMEPAQVIIARSAAVLRSDGRKEQEIGCAIRVGGANIAGLGRVEIGMFGNQNPGKIISMKPGSDFPVEMSLDVGKSYITPMGDFYRDNEVFRADGLMRFPPFGVKFFPVEPIAPLRNARTGEIIGEIRLKWLVPLCNIDPAEEEFPSKEIANATLIEDL